MPEGPELYTSRNNLRKILLGKHISSVDIAPTGRYGKKELTGLDSFKKSLINDVMGITEIDVKGKFMYWTFQDARISMAKQSYFHCTYGMSGQWLINEVAKHPVVSFTFSDGTLATFNDPRHFGTAKFVFDFDEHEKKLASIGPDMMTDCNVSMFIDRLQLHPKKTLAEVLMNQSIVSGIGNYIKAESLYAACLSPHRTVESLSDADFYELYYCVRTVMIDSYNSGGASIRTYSNVDGTPGTYVFRLKVYGKKVDEKGREIIREETRDGRVTWWCPDTQK